MPLKKQYILISSDSSDRLAVTVVIISISRIHLVINPLARMIIRRKVSCAYEDDKEDKKKRRGKRKKEM